MLQTTPQTLYNGVQLLGSGPDLDNIAKIDFGALPMIHRMASTGLQVDLSHFAKMETKLEHDLDRLTEDVYTKTGYRINLDSGDQVSDLLFKKLKIKQARPVFTKSGDRESVENEVLVAVLHTHPVVSTILEYKEVSKLLGTYVRPMPKLARRTKFGVWRMYPNFGTTRIPSGRLNCKQPNLLAMPNRSDRGREVCEGFITREGWVYLSVDESQIEPRIVAHRSHDKNLMNIYHTDQDIYSDFAIAAFKLEDNRYECHGAGNITKAADGTPILCDNLEHVGHGWHYPSVHKKKQRFPAKTCILASIYDVSAKGLVEQLPVVCDNCDTEAKYHDSTLCKKFRPLWQEANSQGLINAFYMEYSGIMDMRRMDHGRLRRYGYVWDDWGRILHGLAVKSVHKWVVSAALREAANFPIQSTAQGTVKLTMAQVDDEFVDMRVYGDLYNPLLQIHDELLGECREDVAQEVGYHIANRFENCVRLDVPIKANIATAKNWGLMPK